METKFTPGPWVVDGPPTNQIVWSSAENRVCFLAHSNGRDDDRDVATGRLIASAPALYEALYRLTTEAKLDGMDKRAGWDAWVSLAEAALRAARGEREDG